MFRNKSEKAKLKSIEILKNQDHENWIMDSGLFTMMFGSESHRKYTREELEQYTHKYIATMKQVGFKGTIVEMDVHKLLGMEALKAFRGIFEANYPVDRTIFVWHIEERIEGLKAMCKRYPYIALSIPELRNVVKHVPLERYINQLLCLCHKVNPNIKIHLLGNTQPNLLMTGLYFSCDSTSWLYDARTFRCSMYTVKDDKIRKDAVHIRKDGLKNFEQIYQNALNNRVVDKVMMNRIGRTAYLKSNVISAANFVRLEKHINSKFYAGQHLK